MWSLFDQLSDQNVRSRIGRRFEAFVEEAFQVVRWSIIVGFAQFLAIRQPSHAFRYLYWFLAALLFGYLASRFLLRPEVRLFPKGAPRWQRLIQSAVNFLLCIVAFAAVLWGITMVVSGLTDYRLAQ